jgi:hypothetical protein
MNLSNVTWSEFYISDIFSIQSGKRLTKTEMTKGKRPFVGASDSNNGITEFIGNKNASLDRNVLGVNYNGSVAENFYHPYECLFSDDVKRFHLKNVPDNKYIYLFFKAIILRQKEKYQYGYKFNELRMKRQKILLPVNDFHEPDYGFMEEYMRTKEKQIIEQYKLYVENIYRYGELALRPVNEWHEFRIGELFVLDYGRSKGLNHLKEVKNGVPYLGATNQNNGVLCFVKPIKKLIQKGNCIAFIRNGEGSMGYSVYKAEDFIATSDITAGYNPNINRYSGMFITTVADRVRGKYNFGYKRSGTRLANETLLLPVDIKGNPDFKYMEDYMLQVEAKQLQKYIEFLEQQNVK